MKTSVDERWARYGRALIGSMSEVLTETADDTHANLLETADYWLSLGLVLGLRQRLIRCASRLRSATKACISSSRLSSSGARRIDDGCTVAIINGRPGRSMN